jgi:hypothetical protein
MTRAACRIEAAARSGQPWAIAPSPGRRAGYHASSALPARSSSRTHPLPAWLLQQHVSAAARLQRPFALKDHTIPRMPFNTIVLSGEISDDENTISWSNDVVWTRVEETTDVPESDSEPKAEDTTGDEAAAAAADAGGEADPDESADKEGTASEKLADTGSVAEADASDGNDGDAQPAGSPPPPAPEEADAGNDDAPALAPALAANRQAVDGSTKTKDSEAPTTGKV